MRRKMRSEIQTANEMNGTARDCSITTADRVSVSTKQAYALSRTFCEMCTKQTESTTRNGHFFSIFFETGRFHAALEF